MLHFEQCQNGTSREKSNRNKTAEEEERSHLRKNLTDREEHSFRGWACLEARLLGIEQVVLHEESRESVGGSTLRSLLEMGAGRCLNSWKRPRVSWFLQCRGWGDQEDQPVDRDEVMRM